MADVGAINIKISASLPDFQNGIKETQTHLSSLSSTLGRIQRTIIAFAAITVFREMAKGIKEVVDLSSDLALTMAHVARLTNMNQEQIGGLTDDFMKLSQTIPLSTNEFAKMAQIAAQAGVETRQGILALLDTAGKFSTLNQDMGTEEAVMALVRLTKAFGDSETMAQNYASALQYAGDVSVGGATEITNAVLRMAASGNTLNMLPEQLMAIASVAIDVGLGAEKAGTTLSRAMLEMTKVSGESLAKLGIDLKAFEEIVSKDATTAFMILLAKINEVPDALEKTRIANEIFKGVAFRAIGPLIPQWEEVVKRINATSQAFIEGKYAAEQFAQVQDTFSNQWKIFTEQINNVKIALGNELLPVLSDFVKGATDWIRTDMAGVVKALGTALITIIKSGALENILKAFAELMTHQVTLNAIVVGFTVMGQVIQAASLALLGIVGAIEFVGKGIAQMVLSFQSGFLQLQNMVMGFFLKIVQGAEKIPGFNKIFGTQLKELELQFKESIDKNIEQIEYFNTALTEGAEDAFNNSAFKLIGDSLTEIPEQIVVAGEAIGTLQEDLKAQSEEMLAEGEGANLMDNMLGLSPEAMEARKTQMEQMMADIAATTTTATQTMSKTMQAVWQQTGQIIGQSIQVFAQGVATAINGVLFEGKKFSDGMKEAFKSMAQSFLSMIVQLIVESLMWLVILTAIEAIFGAGAAKGVWEAGGKNQMAGSFMGFAGLGKSQYGGLIQEPTMMMGMQSGKMGIAGEAGVEKITPMGREDEMMVGQSTQGASTPVNINIQTPFGVDDRIFWDNVARNYIIPAINRSDEKVIS